MSSNSNSNKLVPFDSSDEGTLDRALALVVTNTPHFQSSLGRTDSNTQEMVVSGRHFSGDEMVEAMDGLLVSGCKESTGSVFATQDESDMMAIIQSHISKSAGDAQPSNSPVINFNITINNNNNNSYAINSYTDNTSNTLNKNTLINSSALAEIDSSNDNAVAEPARTPTPRKRSVAAAIDNSPQVVEDTKPAAVPNQVVKKNATARLVVTAGPYTGEVYPIGKGASNKILFGTKPSKKGVPKVDTVISMPLAKNMKASHASLEFVGNKKCLKINVTNLALGGETWINDDPVKKDRVAFAASTITMGDTVMRIEKVSS